MEDTRYLIVGAGMTGLAFANFTQAAADDWLLIERDTAPGGYCKTVKQDGFVWDYSGHFFHFRHPEIEAFLRERMDESQVDRVDKQSGILYRGRRIDFPFQKNIHQLDKDEFIDCLYDLFNRPEREQRTFGDMLYAKFGKAISEKFLVPYNEKLYACPVDQLDKDAMGRFFPYADPEEIVRNFRAPDNSSYNAHFTYPRGGAIEYVNAMLADLPETRIRYGQALTGIDLEARVAQTSAGPVRYEHLITSMPFVKILDAANVPYEPDVYTWNKVLVFNLGFDKKGQDLDHWLYIPERQYCFYRVGFYDNIFQTDRMSLYIEIGMERDAEPGDTDEWLARVLADLKTVGIVDDHELVSWHSVLLDPAYVHITGAAREDFAVKKAMLARHGVHPAGRYGGWTYCAIEDNIVEARALAAALDGA